MDYKKLFGWGAAIWAAAYLSATGFVAYGMGQTTTARITVLVVATIVLWFASRSLSVSGPADALKYSVGWIFISAVLDLFFTVPFTGWAIYFDWGVLASYALALVLPQLVSKRSV